MPKRFTPEEDAEITCRWNVLQQSAGIIAAAMNLTRGQVLGRRHRLGLSARPSPIAGFDAKPEVRAAVLLKTHFVHQARTEARLGRDPRPDRGGCRWIERDDDFVAAWRAGEEIFCSTPCVPGTAWCAKHLKRCYVRTPMRAEVTARPQ